MPRHVQKSVAKWVAGLLVAGTAIYVNSILPAAPQQRPFVDVLLDHPAVLVGGVAVSMLWLYLGWRVNRWAIEKWETTERVKPTDHRVRRLPD